MKTFLKRFLLSTAVACGTSFFLVSCDDEETLGAVPAVTISSQTAGNTTNGSVSTTLTFEAAEGARELIILRNGVAYRTVELNGQTTGTHNFSYTITEALGSRINFTFQVVDSQGRLSQEVPVFVVNVTSRPIRIVRAGNYLGQITWDSDTIYHLHGFVRIGSDVRNADGTHTINRGNNVLTIEPGTLIIGDKETKATLVIQRGARIVANGTRQSPIVFTSEMPAGQRLPGDWGGIVICGETLNNQGQNIEMEGNYGAFHGGTIALTDANHSSGTLRFVRIEYACVPINPNEEVNSLTLGSVGRGTILEYIQTSYGLDDAFEWFGGGANARFLVSYRGLDDDFDVDFGFSGNVQFALAIRDAALADQSGSNGFEVDNNGSGSAATPFTAAAFSNVTIIGPKKTRETTVNVQNQNAAHLRRASQLKIYNSFMTGFPSGIFIDDSRGNTSGFALTNELRVRNTIIAGVEGWGGNGFGSALAAAEGTVTGLPFGNNTQHATAPRGVSLNQSATPGFNIVDWFNTPDFNNLRLSAWTQAGIDPTIFDLVDAPKMTPNAGSILLTRGRWDNVPERANFEQVPFAGAFGTDDWTQGWTEFLPNTVVYF